MCRDDDSDLRLPIFEHHGVIVECELALLAVSDFHSDTRMGDHVQAIGSGQYSRVALQATRDNSSLTGRQLDIVAAHCTYVRELVMHPRLVTETGVAR